MIISATGSPTVLSANTYVYDHDDALISRVVALDTDTLTATIWDDPGGHEVGTPCNMRPGVDVKRFEFVAQSDNVEQELLRRLPQHLHRFVRRGDKARFSGIVRSGSGKTRHEIICSCGHRNYFYVWSWAGHGKAKCSGCKRFIRYRDLDVI